MTVGQNVQGLNLILKKQKLLKGNDIVKHTYR